MGLVQGVAEWLPVSSEGMIALAKANFFDYLGVEELLRFALFLHLGTAMAALLYLRRDVFRLLKSLFAYERSPADDRALVRFLLVSTAVSGTLAFIMLRVLVGLEEKIGLGGRGVTLAVGAMLLVTAYLQIRKKGESQKEAKDLKLVDSIMLGVAQGLASLPGLSRSGTTVSALLFRGFSGKEALRISFLMSIPIVLAGNVALNIGDFVLSSAYLIGMAASFVFGLATIHILLKFAGRVNFGYFVLIFGALMILSAFMRI